jgi:hypothetical protein
VFFLTVTFLPRIFLATIVEYRHRYTDWWEGFMNYTAEMGSGFMIYTPNFIKTGSGIQKLIRGIHRHTNTQTAW